MELSWISLSLARLFSSSGAAFTSSSSWRIMLPIRMTLAGCSTMSVTGRSLLPSAWPCPACPPGAPTAIPPGPTTTTCGRSPACSFMPSFIFLVSPITRPVCPAAVPGPRVHVRQALLRDSGAAAQEQDLPDVGARLHRPVRLGGAGHRHGPVDDGNQFPRADERPHVLADR